MRGHQADIRKVLVVGRFHQEGLSGEVGTTGEEVGGDLTPGELVVPSIRDLVVSTLLYNAFVQA